MHAHNQDAAEMHLVRSLLSLKQIAADAAGVCHKLPDLQVPPTPHLGFSSFAAKTAEVKSTALRDIDVLDGSIARLIQRIGLPVTVGVVGHFSTGKSSLLNSFFRAGFDGPVPKHVLRPTDMPPTTETFAYITHSAFRDRFEPNDQIEVVVADDHMFRTVNFIDTPGTGWRFFSRREVSDLLSAADVILLVSQPSNLFDSGSLQTLDVKFAQFHDVPLWFVITHASDYLGVLGDWSTLDCGRFERNLQTYKTTLAERSVTSEAEARIRDEVVRNVDLRVNENTFLVDAAHDYQTAPLLRRIQESFGSSRARADKRAQVSAAVRRHFGEIASLLATTEEHVQRIADQLALTASGIVETESNRFITGTITGMAAQLSQVLFARLRETPFRVLPAVANNNVLVPITLGYVAPEVSLVERQLDELKRDRDAAGFAYHLDEVLFPAQRASDLVEMLSRDLEDEVRKELDRSFKRAIPSAILGRRKIATDDLTVSVKQTIEDAMHRIRKELSDTTRHRRLALLEVMRKPVGRLSALYHDEEPDATLFSRQGALLRDMRASVPERCASLRDSVTGSSSAAAAYASDRITSFQLIVNRRIDELDELATSYLHESVYRPTKESLDFMFAGNVTLSPPARINNGIQRDVRTKFDISEVPERVEHSTSEVAQLALTELDHLEDDWRTHWQELDADFRKLYAVAKHKVDVVDHRLRELDALLEGANVDGLSAFNATLSALRGRLERKLGTNNDVIERSFRAAQGNVMKGRLAPIGGLVASVCVLAAVVWWGIVPADWGLHPILTVEAWIITAGACLWVSEMVKRLFASGTIEAIVRSNYDVERDTLLDDLRRESTSAKHEIENDLSGRNRDIRDMLARLYNIVIDDFDSARREIVPLLNDQIRVAANLAVNTMADVTAVRERAVDRVSQIVAVQLNRVCEDIEGAVRTVFSDYTRERAKDYAGTLASYSQAYRQIAKELAVLRTQVSLAKQGTEESQA